MYCQKCCVKSDATSQCIMKHHPEVLTLLLKRFELDYRYMMYVRNNRTVVVPYTLQIPENQTYELYATVDHNGGLRRGHYTAKIKSQDDERWYTFNDASVKPHEQPHRQLNQVNNTIESRDVYLLFYRKKKAPVTDTCTQGVKGVFANGNDQSQDVVIEQEEGGKTEEVGDGNTDKDMDKETEKKDSINVDFEDVSYVEDQDTTAGTWKTMPRSSQESNEESSPLCDDPLSGHTEKQKQGGEQIIKHEEEGGERALRVEYQGCGDAGMENITDRRPDMNHDSKPETKPERNDHPDMNEQRGEALGIKKDGDEEAGGDEQFEKMEESSLKNADSHAEDGDNDELNDVGIKKSCAEEKEIDVKKDSEDKTGANNPQSGERRPLTIYNDLYCCSPHCSGSVGDDEEKSPGDDQRCQEKGSDGLLRRREHHKEERRHVEGDKEQTRGDEEPAQGKGTSTTESDSREAPDNHADRSNVVRQSSTEENISGTLTTPEEVPVETPAREKENKGDDEIQNTKEDFQTGSEGREKEETSGYEVVTLEVGGGGEVEKMKKPPVAPKKLRSENQQEWSL